MYPTYLMQLETRMRLADEYLGLRHERRAAEVRDRTLRFRFLGRTERHSRL
jgi:hypothetical protein